MLTGLFAVAGLIAAFEALPELTVPDILAVFGPTAAGIVVCPARLLDRLVLEDELRLALADVWVEEAARECCLA